MAPQESQKAVLPKRPITYDSMYTVGDGLRLFGEIMLLRRIEKDRLVTERLREQQNKNSSTADKPQEAG